MGALALFIGANSGDRPKCPRRGVDEPVAPRVQENIIQPLEAMMLGLRIHVP